MVSCWVSLRAHFAPIFTRIVGPLLSGVKDGFACEVTHFDGSEIRPVPAPKTGGLYKFNVHQCVQGGTVL